MNTLRCSKCGRIFIQYIQDGRGTTTCQDCKRREDIQSTTFDKATAAAPPADPAAAWPDTYTPSPTPTLVSGGGGEYSGGGASSSDWGGSSSSSDSSSCDSGSSSCGGD